MIKPVTVCIGFCMALLLLATHPHAAAKTVWRCGAGATSYSESPCPGGKAVQVADPRSAADVQVAQNDTQRMQALADRMRSQRLDEEARQLANNRAPANLGPNKPRVQHTERIRAKAQKKSNRQGLYRLEEDGTLRAVAAPSRRAKD